MVAAAAEVVLGAVEEVASGTEGVGVEEEDSVGAEVVVSGCPQIGPKICGPI